jgi:hypothetical protein
MLQLSNTCWVKLEPSAAAAHALVFQCHRRSSNALTTHHSLSALGATECVGCVITRDNTYVVACAAPLNIQHLHERKQVVVRRKDQLCGDENAQSQGKSTLVSLAVCSMSVHCATKEFLLLHTGARSCDCTTLLHGTTISTAKVKVRLYSDAHEPWLQRDAV